MSEVYDFSPDESPEYFDYDADRQGLGFPPVGPPVQLAQVPASPRSTTFTFESFAVAVATAHPLPAPVASVPVSPFLSYTSLTGVTPSSLPTELSLPESWASRSPSPIDYENIEGWTEETGEATSPADALEFPQAPEAPTDPPVFENPVIEEQPSPPLRFNMGCLAHHRHTCCAAVD